VGCWVDVSPDSRTVLGVQNHVLGFGNMLGPRYWRRDALVRLWVGPLTRLDFDRFLAGGSAGAVLREMLALMGKIRERFCNLLEGRTRVALPAY
jgi:type VI secretion system protein ImpH